MATIRFTATLQPTDSAAKTDTVALISMPKSASDQLPSRGMTMVEGAINKSAIRVILQPDGQGSHWFGLDEATCQALKLNIGDTVTVALTPSKAWPEPTISTDIQAVLDTDPQANAVWTDITPMARWDWLNWMDAVSQPQTRKERPEKLRSMLRAGKRRPCCFNRSLRASPRCVELVEHSSKHA